MDPNLQNKVELLYDFSIVDVEPLSSDGGGRAYVLHTADSKLLLKKHTLRLSQERLHYQHEIMDELRSQELQVIPDVYSILKEDVPGITLSQEHPTFFTYHNRNFALYEFKGGDYYSWDEKELSDVARVLALFHSKLKDYSKEDYSYVDEIEGFNGKLEKLEEQINEADSYAALNPNLIKELRNLGPVIDDYGGIIKNSITDEDYKGLFKDSTVIHGDFHQKNTLFLDGKVSAILDLDSIRNDRRIYEIAFALFEFTSIYLKEGNSWRFDKLDSDKASIFIDQYQQQNPLKGPLLDGIYIMLMERFLTRLSYGLKLAKEGKKTENQVVREMINSIERLPSSIDGLSTVIKGD